MATTHDMDDTKDGTDETAHDTDNDGENTGSSAYEAVLFDMDGVILEGRGTDPAVHRRALDDVLTDRGLTVPDDHYDALGSDGYDEAFRAACASVGVDAPTLFHEREMRSATRGVARLAAGSRGLYPDVEAIDRLANHTSVGLVSNNYHPTVEFVVDHFRLSAFGVARGRDLGPDGYQRRKPDPHYLNETLDALGVSTGLYVGDRETDVLAAERAGLESVFIRRAHNAAVDLDVEPTVEIESLDALVSLVTA
jgi:phosphoglycolate phosphatase-like HAD superfamily hydrolase